MNFLNHKLKAIAGDASYRKFFRLEQLNKNKIFIFSKKEKYRNLIAYFAINNFLRSKKILAPKIYSHNFSKGMVVVEDFGDLTYYKLLKKSKNKLAIYKKLVDLLLRIEKIKPKSSIKIVGKKRHRINKYSISCLFKESDLFFDWYLPLVLNKKKALNIKKKSRAVLLKLYKKLNFPNSKFVHRDYHSQNLMKVGNKIGVIDSQDAIIGNPTYDLASLIDDVRIKTSRKLKNRIYEYYLKKAAKIYKSNREEFKNDFNILSVQRSLKIIGIFSRLFIRDKKAQYLRFIPYAWQLLEMRMNSEIFSELKKIFNRNISKKFKRKGILK